MLHVKETQTFQNTKPAHVVIIYKFRMFHLSVTEKKVLKRVRNV